MPERGSSEEGSITYQREKGTDKGERSSERVYVFKAAMGRLSDLPGGSGGDLYAEGILS